MHREAALFLSQLLNETDFLNEVNTASDVRILSLIFFIIILQTFFKGFLLFKTFLQKRHKMLKIVKRELLDIYRIKEKWYVKD